MATLREWITRVRGLFTRRAADHSLDDEIRFHLELEAEKYRGLGLTPGEARRRAAVAFGPIEAMKEEHRSARGVRWLEEFIADLRHAARVLRRNPVLTGAAIITLAIGIGANAAIYSAVNAVILRPLPYADPGRLVMLWEENPEMGWHLNVDAPANVLDWKEQVAAFQDVGAVMPYVNSLTLTGIGEPQVLNGYDVTGNFFAVLGVRAALGRTFVDAETWQGGERAVVLSDRTWRDRFHGDPGVIGRTVQLNGNPYQVVGVLPASFTVPGFDADVWTAFGWSPANRTQASFRRAHYLRAIARLRPGATLAAANAELQVVVRRLQQEYPVLNKSMGAGMTPLQQFLVGDTRAPLEVLMAAVGMLLLIACANVGNLVLVQAMSRGREAAVRLALGARRGRLVRQAMTESLLLSTLGGAAGLLLGWCGTRELVALQPPRLLPVQAIGIDVDVIVFVLAVTAVSGMLFALAPVIWQRRRVPVEVLQGAGRRSADRPARRWMNQLVVAEIAVALVMASGAGLLVRSLEQLLRVDPGFDPAGVLSVSMNIPGVRYSDADQVSAFYATLVRHVEALPGVQSAAVVSTLPLTGGVGWTSDFSVAGRSRDAYVNNVAHRSVSPGYFRTMRVPIVHGRDFTDDDLPNGNQVVLINESLARIAFKGEDPVGRRITFDKYPDSTSIWRTIVGVVGDQRQSDLATDVQIEFVSPESQQPVTFMNLVIRTTGDPARLTPAIRGVVRDIDPSLALTSVQTMDQVRDDSVAKQRFLMILLLGFAIAGSVLAAVGVYGVMAQLARARTRELGIRMALGARASGIRWLMLRDGLRLGLAGTVIGLGVAFVACRAMTALLFHVAPGDPVTFAVVSIGLVVTVTVATWLPATRVSRTDPMASLRVE